MRFWVDDNGTGIPLAERQHLFERFHRGSEGRTRSEGAGLGLSIVKAIAEAHHGGVEIVSKTGAGTKFVMTLPVDQPEPTTEDAE